MNEHDWTWHDIVPMWRICRHCLTTRRPSEQIGVYLYRIDGESQWQAEEPACIDPAAQMAAAGTPMLFDVDAVL